MGEVFVIGREKVWMSSNVSCTRDKLGNIDVKFSQISSF